MENMASSCRQLLGALGCVLYSTRSPIICNSNDSEPPSIRRKSPYLFACSQNRYGLFVGLFACSPNLRLFLRVFDHCLVTSPPKGVIDQISMTGVMKINKGKQKISIEPIQNKAKKQVSFSKRRNGLFKKASELCSMSGAQVAVITFSPAGKLFSFGHPSSDAVIQRYINDNTETNEDGLINFWAYSDDGVTQVEAGEKATTKIMVNENGNNNDSSKLWVLVGSTY
ncbi:Agamous-like MADS-box protein AGL62 [Bienertia sinuspersici]